MLPVEIQRPILAKIDGRDANITDARRSRGRRTVASSGYLTSSTSPPADSVTYPDAAFARTFQLAGIFAAAAKASAPTTLSAPAGNVAST